jgi:polysaccharide export outer membrane protein
MKKLSPLAFLCAAALAGTMTAQNPSQKELKATSSPSAPTIPAAKSSSTPGVPAATSDKSATTSSSPTKSPSTSPAVDAIVSDPNYRIGPSDVISVVVWHEPDFSTSAPVRPDGKISLPLIGEIQAAGLRPAELDDNLTTALKKFVSDPRVTVTVNSINSRQIYLMGEVLKAGAVPMTAGMTVLQALATGGGFSQYADLKKIYVLRTQNGTQVKLPFNYKEVIKGRSTEQNIVLIPGDTIVVP